LRKQWLSHLCGLCLTLRDEAGQAARILTGYDVLIPSVLVEAQTGRAAKVTAGRCPLRGLRTAEVVSPDEPGIRFAAGASLLNGGASLDDKIVDADVPGWTAPALGRAAKAARRHGIRLTDESGFEAAAFADASRAAATAEVTGTTLDEYLEPAGRAGAALFGHTAQVAGRPQNEEPLNRAGGAFGRLVHLLDAVEDYRSDLERGAFNPLAASATPPDEAHREARHLAGSVHAAVDEAFFVDPALASALLGPVLEQAVERRFRPHRAGSAAVAAMAVPMVLPAIFGGRRWGRRPPPGYYGGPYGPYDPYDPYYGGYGYRRRFGGFSCCDLLACNCCANCACNECCGGGDDDCCCCCC
jgi:hypothetical protein